MTNPMPRTVSLTAFRSVPVTLSLAIALTLGLSACHRAQRVGRLFETPEQAAQALVATVKAGNVDDLVAIFGPDSKDLVASAYPVDARNSRDVFTAAAHERWHLEDGPDGAKILVVGNEDWPFPVPIVRDKDAWRFDTAAGRDEVIARRVGRNELQVIQLCRTYVTAQRLYALTGHDGQSAGAFATSLRSDAGRQNGLYWPSERHEKRSPLGDMLANAAQDAKSLAGTGTGPSPFHGYYFRILTAQGVAAPGGAKDYVVGGRMTGGFALVAWPAAYDSSGVMTFIVSADGVVREKDLGPDTDKMARSMNVFDPDASWTVTEH